MKTKFQPATIAPASTGTVSGDSISLTLSMVASMHPEHEKSVTALGAPFVAVRDRVRKIASDANLTDAGKSAAVRDSVIPAALDGIRAERVRVSHLAAQAHNERLVALRERRAAIDARVARNQKAVADFEDVLRRLDPLVSRIRLVESAREFQNSSADGRGEKWPYLVAAGERVREAGYESESPAAKKAHAATGGGGFLPVIDAATGDELDSLAVAAASNADEVARLDAAAQLHRSVLATVERSIGSLVAAYDSSGAWVTGLAALPDGKQ